MPLMCVRQRPYKNQASNTADRMKHRHQSYTRTQSRVSPSLNTAIHVNPVARAGAHRGTRSPHWDCPTESLCVTCHDDITVEVSQISRLSAGRQAPGAQCSTNELGLSMGPLHSTMDYPQHSTPDRPNCDVSEPSGYRPARNRKSNCRLSPLGEERPKRVRCPVNHEPPTKSTTTTRRSRGRLSLMNCFSRKSAEANRKSKALSSLPNQPKSSESRDVSEYYSVAVNAGSWLEDNEVYLDERIGRYKPVDGGQRENDLSCCTEHHRSISPEQARANSHSSGSVMYQRLASPCSSMLGEGRYIGLNWKNDRSVSSRSRDSFFSSPAPTGSRPPCIGKEVSPARTFCSRSGSSSGYQSTRDCSSDIIVLGSETIKNSPRPKPTLNRSRTETVCLPLNLSFDDWKTLAVF